VSSDTDRFAAIRGDVADLGADVAGLTERMVAILELVAPLLRRSADNERQHATRSDHFRHTGRHRRDRLPPGCQS
jgi:hypothetical protein